VASFCGHPTLVEHLLNHGADVGSRGGRAETPLHLAAVGSTTTVVTILLKAGANVNDVALVSAFVQPVERHNYDVSLLVPSSAAIMLVA